MKSIKKLLFIASFFLFLVPAKIYASEGEELAEQIYTVAETDDISIEKVVGVYDFEGNEIGACMQCVSDGMDYGYVICDTDKNIIEYSVGAGYPFLYDVLSDSITEGYVMSQTDCIFTTDKLQYYVEVSDGTEKYLFAGDGSYLETDGVAVEESEVLWGWHNIIKDAEDYSLDNNYTRLSNYYNYDAVMFSQEFFENNCNRYACAVVAMLCVCAQEGYFQLRNSNGTYNINNIIQAFDALWEISGTCVSKIEEGIQYGLTYASEIARTIRSFGLAGTGTIPDVIRIDEPSWSQIVARVGQGMSTIFGCGIRYNDNGTIKNSEHCVNVVGYTTYRENSTGNTLSFLTIGDGWYDYPRYFLFDNSKFYSSYIFYVA